jgi:flagellar hook-associated protein 1
VSIGSTFNIARTALNAHQAVIQTAGHNIANVETEGYTRQRVDLVPTFPHRSPDGLIGTGVKIENVTRVRDQLLDATYRREQGDASAATLRHELLAGVEAVLGEPSDDGLASAMDAFWSSWSDLANNPANVAARSVVQQRGANVASMLNRFDGELKDMREQSVLRVGNAVEEINALADEIALLNGRIVGAEAGGASANDLRDLRDRAIDKLSKHGTVRAIDSVDGTVQIVLGNNGVVDGVTARHFAVTDDGTTLAVRFSNSSEPMLPIGGSVRELVNFVNAELPDARGRLDTIARTLVSRVNAAHAQGQTFAPNGTATAAGDFFHRGDVDPSAPPALLPVTAASIRLSDAVAASAANVAASAAVPGAGQVAGPGNNEVALAIAGFRTRADSVTYVAPDGTTETASFANFYRDTTTLIGTRVKDAEGTASVHEALASQADARRISVSGVNMDEELTRLMSAQQAYAAAAKVVSAAEEMLRTLVEMV